MKNKLLILASAVAVLLGMNSCASDYCYSCRTERHYPPVYRTYQDKDHGGMDYDHGGKYCNHAEPVYY